MEPIRILHVLGTLNLGGAESRIMDLYRNIDRSKVQFDFLIHNDTPQYYEDEVKQLGGRIYCLPRFRGVNLLSYRKAAKNFFREHKEYAAVHGHMTSTASIYLPIAKKMGIPMTIAHARSAGVDPGIKGAVTKVLRKNLAEKTDYCFTCSALAGEAVFGKKAMEEGRVRILPNAIEASKYKVNDEIRTKIRDELNLSDQFVVGHVGRFSFMKNHVFLLNVFEEIKKQRENSHLLLLGDGEEREKIERLAKEKGLDKSITFTGNKKNVHEYCQAFDCFVFPSIFEGLPGTVVEAQAAGLPCFVADTITEEVSITPLVHRLSLEQSAKEWAEYILEKIKEDKDGRKDMVPSISKAGFDVKTQVEEMTSFYQTANKKKIMLMVPMLHQGGFERVCVLTARLLQPNYQVFVCVFDLSDLAYHIEGLNVIHLNLGVKQGKLGKVLNVLRRVRKVTEVKRKFGIHITYSFGPTANLVNVLSKGSKRWCGIRSYMDLDPSNHGELSLFTKNADKIISCSAVIEEELREKYRCRSIDTLYNPYDSKFILSEAEEEVKDYPWDKEYTFTLVSMGREDDIKGFWHMIKAFSLVAREKEEARLMIIGDGKYTEYKELANALGIGEKVHFTGVKKNPYPYLAFGKIYLLTSYHEGFPNALVEAMTLGIPVISTDCKTGPREILLDEEGKETYGVLISNMNPNKNLDPKVIEDEEKELAKIILSLGENKDRYDHYAKMAVQRAKEFSFSAYTKKISSMIDEETE